MISQSATNGAAQDTVFDVDVEQLARLYAQAALDAAGDQTAQEKLMDELRALVAEVLDQFPALEQIFSSALVSQEEKLRLLDRLFGSRLSATTLHVLKVMVQRDRLSILRQVVRSANKLWEKRSGRLPVELRLAQQTDESLQQEVVQALRDFLGAEPVVKTVIDPELIAGFVVRVGDKVYDASARTSFEKARQAMKARAIDAMQRRPGQFMENLAVVSHSGDA